MARLRVLVLFGGRSGEHEVSVRSAERVVDALGSLGHDVVPVGIAPSGRTVRCDPHDARPRVPEGLPPYPLAAGATVEPIDVAFPVLHGPYGEDGCIQGWLELVDVAYVGARVEASAICMDKVLQKRLFALDGLPVVDFVEVRREDWDANRDVLLTRARSLGLPCFAKPSHLGSSVGISRVAAAADLADAIERALRHDDVALVEASGGPRELEVGVVAGDVSLPGEVIAAGDFYDYRSKYTDDGCELRVPADVPAGVVDRIRDFAARAFRVTGCEGLARVDLFYDPARDMLLVNEINSIPGMTATSMFPRVWERSGAPFPTVVQRLLDDALARHGRKARLERTRAGAHDEEIGSRIRTAR